MKIIFLNLFICFFSLLVAQSVTNLTVAEKATFKIYKNQTDLGTINYEIDEKGNYKRTFVLNFAGQVISYKLSIQVHEDGTWKNITIDVPNEKIEVVRKDDIAEYKIQNKDYKITLSKNHVIYDSYGPIFESIVLKKYDKQKGGKQKFPRFFVPSSCGDVEVEYISSETRVVHEKELLLQRFQMNVLGVMLGIWVDSDYKVYMIHVPTQYAIYIREGFQDLMKPKSDDLLLSQPKFEIKKETIFIPMRDEIKLATDMYFPESQQTKKFPTILIRTPYKKEIEELKANFYARRGYIVAVQDCRGRFSSEGTWEPFVNEANDGYDTVEWLAIQENSNGKIGMIGASYVGWTQLWAASAKPPHLTTIIPNVAPPDPFYNIPYEYGSFYLFGSIWWAQILEAKATDDLSGKKIQDINTLDYNELLSSLPVIDLDKKIFQKENPYWRKWIENNENTGYWEKSNFMEDLGDLNIPVFLQSGWFDGDGIGSKLNYSYLKQSPNKNQKLIIGPWGHTDTSSNRIGSLQFGNKASLDLQTLYLRWFDRWLKDMDNKIEAEPLVKIFVMFSDTWLEAETYPLPQTNFTKFFLSSKEGANTLKGDGLLLEEIVEDSREFDEYVYDPINPTPCPDFQFPQNEGNENKNDTEKENESKDKNKNLRMEITSSHKDILIYQTAPLSEEISIAGPISAQIYAATSAQDTDWFVSLVDIDENGNAIFLTKGVIRARFRTSTKKSQLLEPNKIYEYNIDMWQTGITFKKGHRIRIEIASAMFPLFSRNLNTGGHNEMEVESVIAEQKIYHSEEYPSHILLPVVKLK